MSRASIVRRLAVLLSFPWAPYGIAAAAGAEPVAHEQPPTGPWVPPLRSSVTAGAGCRSHIVRDGFTSIQVNVDARGCNVPGDAANESSIAVSLTDRRKLVIGWRQFNSVKSGFREAGWAYSHDGGHTWVFHGSIDPGVFGSDPVLMSESDGEILYFSAGEPSRVFQSRDAGLSWHVLVQWPGIVDKPWMAVDPTEGIGHGNLYIASYGYLTRSVDGGRSFSSWIDVNNYDCDLPVGGDYPTLAVGSDGVLYYAAIPGLVSRSTNAAFTEEVPSFECPKHVTPFSSLYSLPGTPNPGGLHGQVWIETHRPVGGTQDEVYVGGPTLSRSGGYDLDLTFARSADSGHTWSEPIRINDDALDSGAWQWFGMISVAPNGRIDAVWNDTRNYLNLPEPNFSELYYASSLDAGRTWSTNVPVSPVFDSYLGWASGQLKLGDYYHMVSDNLGVNVAYAATFNGEQDVYFLRIGPWDCNGNEIDDALDIREARSLDCNANDVPDECEYRADVNGDGLTTLSDFAAFQRALTGPGSTLASASGYDGPLPDGRGSDLQSPIDNRQSTISCLPLLDPDHDADIDLHDFYLFQNVFVNP